MAGDFAGAGETAIGVDGGGEGLGGCEAGVAVDDEEAAVVDALDAGVAAEDGACGGRDGDLAAGADVGVVVGETEPADGVRGGRVDGEGARLRRR
jgi:hypothetical protein